MLSPSLGLECLVGCSWVHHLSGFPLGVPSRCLKLRSIVSCPSSLMEYFSSIMMGSSSWGGSVLSSLSPLLDFLAKAEISWLVVTLALVKVPSMAMISSVVYFLAGSSWLEWSSP